MNNEQLFAEIKGILVNQFEILETDVTLDANLYEKLDLDSIDAVDLMVHLKEFTGKKIPPEQFKEIRTIRDILDSLAKL